MRSGQPDDSSSHIDDLLNDPIVRKVMDADKVDTSALLAILVRTARRLKELYPDSTAGAPVVSERVPPLDTQLRPGVGVMLVNGIGQVFVGKRIDMIEEAWQMPQGGIDGDETPIIAAMRELPEELGTANVEVVAESSRWLQYELPSSLQGRAWGGQWRGQRQKWFLMRFLGDDREINIATVHPEFSDWRWVPPERLVDLIVSFKRRLYLDIVEEFAHFLSRAPQKGGDRP
jgi:putative (di)nucleoside polyphosphate hydrolase